MKRILSAFLLLALLCDPAYGAISPSYPVTLQNGTTADASQVMADFYQIQSDVNTFAAHNGANSDITSLTGLTTALALQYGGTPVYVGGTTGGSANAQTLVTVSPTSFTLTAGAMVTGIAGYTNTGATTLAVNSLSATAVRVADSTGLHALVGGEIFTGNSYVWYFDGTYLDLLNPSVLTSGNIPSSAALAGSPTTTTQSSADNSTKVATTAYVTTAIGNIPSVSFATKSDMQAATSTTLAVNPAQTQNHPGVAKAWVVFDGTAGSPTAAAGYNIASITKNGTGDYTINFTTSFSSANYASDGTASWSATNPAILFTADDHLPTASAYRFYITNFNGVPHDSTHISLSFFGAQ